jgi:hypothetical protein
VSKERVWFLLPLFGILLHLALWGLLRPIFDIDQRQQQEWAWSQRDPVDLGDEEISYAITQLGVLPCVYCPSILLAVLASLYHLYKHRETKAFATFCLGTGIFSVLYALLLLAPNR